ncbi:hypothetical protein [Methylobacterium sp. Leaf456]|uniref:hypothetical protein n=1 Tax=Methylobacterium sp. Leaf456 TaxID=1736382 RepID=UPI000AE069E9|nr:hypothetical protein [Methylobacterium sp. Leaf456]
MTHWTWTRFKNVFRESLMEGKNEERNTAAPQIEYQIVEGHQEKETAIIKAEQELINPTEQDIKQIVEEFRFYCRVDICRRLAHFVAVERASSVIDSNRECAILSQVPNDIILSDHIAAAIEIMKTTKPDMGIKHALKIAYEDCEREKMATSLRNIIEPHAPTLSLKWVKLVKLDDYGKFDTRRWDRECKYFITQVVIPESDYFFEKDDIEWYYVHEIINEIVAEHRASTNGASEEAKRVEEAEDRTELDVGDTKIPLTRPKQVRKKTTRPE